MLTDHTIVIPAHCVIVPFLNRHEQVARCMNALLEQAKPNTVFLLVDDGSTPQAIRSMLLQPILCKPNVHVLHHKDNYGVAAARNSALHWCRQHAFDIVIMIDSDCIPDDNVIDEHLRLHQDHPEAICIGARITGTGDSFWAKLDGVASWVHAMPHGHSQNEFRPVEHPYHLPTTNFSARLAKLPARDFVFDERLKTGEDCLLVRELRRLSLQDGHKRVFFSSTPTVYHEDRVRMLDVLRHHYEWGHHQYFIQLGGDISPRCFHPLYRLLFICGFLPLLPLFALAGSFFNIKPLLMRPSAALLFYPLVYLLWFAKGIAVLEAAIRPQHCTRRPRQHIEYEEALLE